MSAPGSRLFGPGADELVYRDRKARDLPLARDLIARSLRSDLSLLEGDLAADIDQAVRPFRDDRDFFQTAELSGRVVGVVVTIAEEGDARAASIAIWGVDPPSRGQGVGRSLLFRAVEAHGRRATSALRAHVFASTPAAPRLFWRQGFRAVELRSTRLGGREREVVVFEKKLPA